MNHERSCPDLFGKILQFKVQGGGFVGVIVFDDETVGQNGFQFEDAEFTADEENGVDFQPSHPQWNGLADMRW